VYAFSRISDADDVEYVVAANNAETPQTVSFDTFGNETEFAGLWPGGTESVRASGDGQLTVTLPPLSVRVWKAARAVPDTIAAPRPVWGDIDASAGGRVEIGVEVPGGGFNQVTFAWRPAGATTWQILGSDDNAPYRVFHDVRGLAPNAPVEYRAVLRDHSGNIATTG